MRTEKETQQKAKNKTKNNKEEGDELQTITRKKEREALSTLMKEKLSSSQM